MYLRQAWRSMMEFGPRDQAAAGAGWFPHKKPRPPAVLRRGWGPTSGGSDVPMDTTYSFLRFALGVRLKLPAHRFFKLWTSLISVFCNAFASRADQLFFCLLKRVWNFLRLSFNPRSQWRKLRDSNLTGTLDSPPLSGYNILYPACFVNTFCKFSDYLYHSSIP